MTSITYRDDRDLPFNRLVALNLASAWSLAEKGEAFQEAMRGSHSVVTAWSERSKRCEHAFSRASVNLAEWATRFREIASAVTLGMVSRRRPSRS